MTSIDIQNTDGTWRRGTLADAIAAEDAACKAAGAPTSDERREEKEKVE